MSPRSRRSLGKRGVWTVELKQNAQTQWNHFADDVFGVDGGDGCVAVRCSVLQCIAVCCSGRMRRINGITLLTT